MGKLYTVAATGEEESFAAFCPPFDRIAKENNRETFSCLGDIFTIGWILDDAGQVAGQVARRSNVRRDHDHRAARRLAAYSPR